MAPLVWAFMFLLLSVAGSMIALAAMIGMPIPIDVQYDVFAMAALVVGSGIVLTLTSGDGTGSSA